jgi:hypothetical protein
VRHYFRSRAFVTALMTLVCSSLTLALAGCGGGGDDGDDNGGTTTVGQFRSALAQLPSGATVNAVVRRGFPSSSELTSDAAPTLSGSTTSVRGGSVAIGMTVTSAVDRILVGLRGSNEYFDLDVAGRSASLPVVAGESCGPGALKYLEAHKQQNPVTRQADVVYNIVIPVPTNATTSSNEFQIVVQRGGRFSQLSSRTVGVNGTAQSSNRLQFTLTWDAPVDLDLFVQTPNGNVINFASSTGQNGGALDLDSNAACDIDNINNENITWRTNEPARGTYTVYPNLFSACSRSGPFRYTLTINNNGQQTIRTGTVSAVGDGPKVTVTY